MPTESPPKPKATKQTWRDWFPNATPTMSADELMDTLEARGVALDKQTLRFWQREGLLPYPNRRRIGNSTYAVYPEIAIQLIEDIRRMQQSGRSLKDIRPWIRGLAVTYQAPDPLKLSKEITQAARNHEMRFGVPVERAVVTFIDRDENETSYAVALLDER